MSASTLRFPSATNHLPRETGQVIAFIRNRDGFKMNQYVQIIPASADSELRYSYFALSRDDSVRVPNTDKEVWADGDSRKAMGKDQGHRFRMQTGVMTRRNWSCQVGWMTNANTHSWNVLATEMEGCGSRAMTSRCLRLWDATNGLPGADWQGNVADANTLNGGKGKWKDGSDDPNSGHYNAIQTTLYEAVTNIKLMTNNRVKASDLKLVINPYDAIQLALAPEIRHILNYTQVAKQVLENQPDLSEQLGLPLRIAGIEIVIEDAAVVTETPKASGVEASANIGRRFIMPSGTAYLLSRPGSLDGAPGAPSFSTAQIYHAGGLLESEGFPDAEDRLTRAHVSETMDFQFPAGVAGYKITNIV